LQDYDAQRSFSKLRTTTGHLYQHRKMLKEAEIAYRQSLVLWPGNPESLNALSGMLWERGDYDGVIKMIEPANAEDPNNFSLWRVRVFAEKRKELADEIRGLTDALEKNPKDRENTLKLIDLYTASGETNKITLVLDKTLELFRDDPGFLRKAVEYGEKNNIPAQEVAAAQMLVSTGTNSGEDYLLLARALFRNNDKTNFYPAARTAIQKGGLPMREAIFAHPLFAPWRGDEEFKKLRNPLPEKK
jgi:tetratricopeptide (TPR) repeat protein